jgi:hypothetical protein
VYLLATSALVCGSSLVQLATRDRAVRVEEVKGRIVSGRDEMEFGDLGSHETGTPG